jgi:hypothetical protein
MVDLGVLVTMVGAEPGVSRIYVGIVSILKEESKCEKKEWGFLIETIAPWSLIFSVWDNLGIMSYLGGLEGSICHQTTSVE